MEGLSNLIQPGKSRGRVRGFQMGDLEVKDRQYANDTRVFCGATREQMLILKVIFNIRKIGGKWVNSQPHT